MNELFSEMQISRLYAEFSKLERVDPCGPTYPKLIATLDAMSLPQLRDAKIKFLGKLAANRIWNAERAA